MIETIEAIYQNGMFKPINPIPEDISEGEKVKLVVETGTENEEINPIMKLAENFYEDLSAEDIEEIEKVTLDRSNFFGNRQI